MTSRIGSIPADKRIHLAAGMAVAVIGAFALPQTAPWALVCAIAAGAMKETADLIRKNRWDFVDLTYTAFGGLLIQILVWL